MCSKETGTKYTNLKKTETSFEEAWNEHHSIYIVTVEVVVARFRKLASLETTIQRLCINNRLNHGNTKLYKTILVLDNILECGFNVD